MSSPRIGSRVETGAARFRSWTSVVAAIVRLM